MADNKQYITQRQENGSVMISEDVVSTIVAQAVKDVEGIAALNTKTGSDLADMIGKKSWGKGIRINVADDNTLTIDCDVIVRYGQSVVTVAAEAQKAVFAALETATGVAVDAVNVNVCGIVR